MRSNTSLSGRVTSASPEGLQLAILGPEGPPRSHQIVQQPFAVLGRSAECDVPLDSPDVSYRHTYLQHVGGQLFSIDLGSRTGTYWRGGRRSRGWILPDDSLQIGPFSLSLRVPQAVTPAAVSLVPPDFNPLERYGDELGPLPEVEIAFLNTDPPQPAMRISRVITLVGSSRRCKLRLDHPSVSSFHGSLFLSPEGLWVIDLLGRDGIRVSGQRERFAKLEEGTQFLVGRFLMQVHYLKQTETENPAARIADTADTRPAEVDHHPHAAIVSISAPVSTPSPTPGVGLHAELDAQSNIFETEEADLESLREELQKGIAAQNAERSAIEEICKEIDGRTRSLDAEQARCKALQQELATEREELAAAKEKLDTERAAGERQREELRQLQTALKEKETSLSAQAATLVEQTRALEQDRKELVARAAKLEQGECLLASERQSLGDQQTQLRADRQAIAAQESALDTGRREIAVERATLDEARRVFAEERQAIETLQLNIEAEQRRLEEVWRTAESLSRNNAEKDAELTRLRARLSQEQNTLAADREKAIAEQQAATQSLEQRAQELTQDEHALKEQRTQLEERWAEYRAARAAFDDEQDQQSQQHQETQEQLDRERLRLQSDRADLDKRRKDWEVERSTKAEDVYTAELDRLAAERICLQDDERRLASEKAELDNLRTALEAAQHQMAASQRRLAEESLELKNRQQLVAADQEALQAERAELVNQAQQLAVEAEQLQNQRRAIDIRVTEMDRFRAEITALREQLSVIRGVATGDTELPSDSRPISAGVNDTAPPRPASNVAHKPANPPEKSVGPMLVESTRRHKVYRAERYDEVLVVSLQGDTNQFQYTDLQAESNRIRRLFDRPDVKHLVLDFGEFESLSTVLLNVSAWLARRIASSGARVVLCRASQPIQTRLEMMQLLEMWTYFPTREEALRSLSQ